MGAFILCFITLVERLSPPEDDNVDSSVDEIDIECGDVLPNIEVLTLVSNSMQDINISTASFDSILVLGVRNSRHRHTDPPEDLTLRRFQSPTVLTSPTTGRMLPTSRVPRLRTVSVGDQDIRPRRLANPAHTKDGLMLDIKESTTSRGSRDIVISCYSAMDLSHVKK